VVVTTDEGVFQGVCNIGNRPTVNGNELRLEVHLFDFDGQIYGQHIEVAIVHKLRDEHKFDSLEMLKQQIAVDVTAAKHYFEHNTHP
jgi:riboflavin kinase/FMN adenylyltransferase